MGNQISLMVLTELLEWAGNAAGSLVAGLSPHNTAVDEKLEDMPFIVALKPTKKLAAMIADEHQACLDCTAVLEMRWNSKNNSNSNSNTLSELLEKNVIRSESARDFVRDFVAQNSSSADEPPSPRFRRNFRKHVENVTVEKCTKAIEKHVRRESLKVHPDRHGETFRNEFQALCEARDCMADPELRRDYITKMIKAYDTTGRRSVPDAHERWLRGEDDDDADMNEAQSSDKKKKKKQDRTSTNKTNKSHQQQQQQGPTMAIEGGIGRDQPKRIQYRILEENKKQVLLILTPLKPSYEFFRLAESLQVVGYASSVENEVVLLKMNQSQIQEFQTSDSEDNEQKIEYIVDFPSYDTWTVAWQVTFRFGGGWLAPRIVTPESYGINIELESPEEFRLRKLRAECRYKESQVPRRIGDIKVALRRLEGPRSLLLVPNQSGSSSRQEGEFNQAYNRLHSAVVKGRSLERRLRFLSKETGGLASSPTLRDLGDALTLTHSKMDELELARGMYELKDTRRKFKEFIAGVLESGEAPNWVAKVDANELDTLGGDANRLYQLLVEGKGMFRLEMDPEMLHAASKRTDLFSQKQCGVLIECKARIEAEHITEEQRIKQEDEQREKELLSLIGKDVVFKDLQTRPELNGTVGRVLNITDNKDRYTIRCHKKNAAVDDFDDGEIVAVKFGNTVPYQSDGVGVGFGDSPPNLFLQTAMPITQQGANPPAPVSANSASKDNTFSYSTAPLTSKDNVEANENTLQMTPTAQPQALNNTAIPWNCANCAFEHAGQEAMLDYCKLCNSPRDPETKSYSGRALLSERPPLTVAFVESNTEKGDTTNQSVASKDNSVALMNTAKFNDLSTLAGSESKENKSIKACEHRCGDLCELLTFLEEQKDCIKGSPAEFCSWLKESEDIVDLSTLVEAVSDENYIRDTLQVGNGKIGIKGFKRSAFRAAVLSRSNSNSPTAVVNLPSPPDELYCPISHELMTKDPVLSKDGFTYERKEIEAWFQSEKNKIADAQIFLLTNPSSRRHLEIVQRGVRSPMRPDYAMPALTLDSNHGIRTMASDYKARLGELASKKGEGLALVEMVKRDG